ncbi:hypothetical protein D3C75_762350 [compost metagenome]
MVMPCRHAGLVLPFAANVEILRFIELGLYSKSLQITPVSFIGMIKVNTAVLNPAAPGKRSIPATGPFVYIQK